MMESEDLIVFMAAIYQADRSNHARRPGAGRAFLALVCVLVLAKSASAEPTWVLWEESNELHAFARNPANRVRATYTTVGECIKAIDAAWQKTTAARPTPDGGSYRLGPTSAVMIVRYGNTTQIVTYTCLPDSTYPPF